MKQISSEPSQSCFSPSSLIGESLLLTAQKRNTPAEKLKSFPFYFTLRHVMTDYSIAPF